VIAGARLRGEVHFDEVLVAEATTGGSPTTTLDVSAGAHQARVSAALAVGDAPGDGRYSLGVKHDRRPRPPT
jgi:hypothetical protein